MMTTMMMMMQWLLRAVLLLTLTAPYDALEPYTRPKAQVNMKDDIPGFPQNFPKDPDWPRLQEVGYYEAPTNAWTQKIPKIDPNTFAKEIGMAPKAGPSLSPPPVAPSGRWLHSAVFIDGKMYVFGGVGSYSTALYNDMWLYNFVESTWTELQASYVPPFPNHNTENPQVMLPQGPIQMFRPDDSPPEPPVREHPRHENTFIPLPFLPQSGIDAVYEAPTKGKPVKVSGYKPPAYRGDKPPGYSFIEESFHLHRVHKAMEAPAFGYSHDEIDKWTRAHRVRKQQKKWAGMSLLEVGTRQQRASASVAAAASAPAEPPRFWKSDALSPKLMSPFIAADLWQYDVETEMWENIKSGSKDIPAPRWLHSAVNIKDRMVIFGGVSYSDIILGDVWIYMPRPKQWLKANPSGDPILPREGHSAVVMNEQEMYVFGGISYGHIPFNDLWVYNGASNTWSLKKPSGPLPPPRWLHASAQIDYKGHKKLFIFGGVTRNYIPMDDLWAYDLSKSMWTHPTSKTLPPYPRMMHTAIVLHATFMVFGGSANNMPLEDIWAYDVMTETWDEEHPTTQYPFAREGASLIKVVPEEPKFEPEPREPWLPPEPVPPAEQDTPEELMPTIKNYTTERPLNRYRKEFEVNRFVIIFGGAGPKPV